MRPIGVMLLVLAIAFSISSCSRGFKLATIPAEEIPITLRERAIDVSQGTRTNLVWRAFYEQDGYLIGVHTHASTRNSDTRRMVQWETMHIDSGRWSASATAWGVDMYSRGLGRGRDPNGVLHIRSQGWAFNRAAHKVVGTTDLGRSVEGLVVNGFWFIIAADAHPDEAFETIVVEDDQGNVLHTY